MIDPKELRLGNYVQTYTVFFDGMRSITEPDITKKQVDLKDLEIMQSVLATYRPIPITPDILEKAEFKRIFKDSGIGDCAMQFGSHHILLYEDITRMWSFDGIELPNQPQFLHQVQNLYYVLSGKELVIQKL